MSFGADNPKESLLLVKLLTDYAYNGAKTFDAHPLRTEADPWDFVERCMRAYKALELKVDEVNSDAKLCAMLEELVSADAEGWGDALSCYSRKSAAKLRGATFHPDKLAERRLRYERIDQRLTEILLGVE
jgi:hypothetical protein